jgi:hypothetical protein
MVEKMDPCLVVAAAVVSGRYCVSKGFVAAGGLWRFAEAVRLWQFLWKLLVSWWFCRTAINIRRPFLWQLSFPKQRVHALCAAWDFELPKLAS